MITFIITADLHLGLQTSDIDNNNNTSKCFDFIIQKAIENQVDFLLIAGDIFDKINPSQEVLQNFIYKMRILKENNIIPIIIAGNHDTPRSINRVSVCKLVEKAGLGIVLDNNLSFTEKTVKIRNSIVSFLGKAFNHKHNSIKEKFEINTRNKEINLRIGLYHGDIDKGFYEPARFEAFVNSDIDLWVIGHKHKASYHRTNNNVIIIPGSIDRFSFNQEDYEPGIFIVNWLKDKKDLEINFLKTPSKILKSITINNLNRETNDINKLIEEKIKFFIDETQKTQIKEIICRLVLEGKISREQFNNIEFKRILNSKNNVVFKKFTIDTSKLLIEDSIGIFTQGNFDLATVFQVQINHRIVNEKSESEKEFYRKVLSKGLSLINSNQKDEISEQLT